MIAGSKIGQAIIKPKLLALAIIWSLGGCIDVQTPQEFYDINFAGVSQIALNDTGKYFITWLPATYNSNEEAVYMVYMAEMPNSDNLEAGPVTTSLYLRFLENL